MVLGERSPGRVGRRRFSPSKSATPIRDGALRRFRTASASRLVGSSDYGCRTSSSLAPVGWPACGRCRRPVERRFARWFSWWFWWWFSRCRRFALDRPQQGRFFSGFVGTAVGRVAFASARPPRRVERRRRFVGFAAAAAGPGRPAGSRAQRRAPGATRATDRGRAPGRRGTGRPCTPRPQGPRPRTSTDRRTRDRAVDRRGFDSRRGRGGDRTRIADRDAAPGARGRSRGRRRDPRCRARSASRRTVGRAARGGVRCTRS
jgi:hypothetical protein